MLQDINVNYTLMKAIQNLYKFMKSPVKIQQEKSKPFEMNTALRQDQWISPTILKYI